MFRVSVILVAAGSGTRMGGVPKQFLHLGSMTVVEHSIHTFAQIPSVAEIIVVTKEEEISRMKSLLDESNGRGKHPAGICGQRCGSLRTRDHPCGDP